MEKELRINMQAKDTLSKDGEILVDIWFEGNTYEYKSEIKAIGGYCWDSYDKVWAKLVKLSQLQEEIKKATEIGAEAAISEQEFLESRSYKLAEAIAKDYREKQHVRRLLSGEKLLERNGDLYEYVETEGNEYIFRRKSESDIARYVFQSVNNGDIIKPTYEELLILSGYEREKRTKH